MTKKFHPLHDRTIVPAPFNPSADVAESIRMAFLSGHSIRRIAADLNLKPASLSRYMADNRERWADEIAGRATIEPDRTIVYKRHDLPNATVIMRPIALPSISMHVAHLTAEKRLASIHGKTVGAHHP